MKSNDEIKVEAEEPENLKNGHISPKMEVEEVENKMAQKRNLIAQLSEKLAAEEARYTVFKKIRLSQLSTESHQKEKTSAPNQDLKRKRPTSALKNNNSSGNNTPDPSRAKYFDKSFKPIKPAGTTGKTTGKVEKPTPVNGSINGGIPALPFGNHHRTGSGRPSKINSSLKDLDDIHQLAAYLANNQTLSDSDKIRARKMVFKKQLSKYVNAVPAPELEKPDIIFFPTINSGEFVNLIGLEQVVNNIKLQNAKKKGGDRVIHGHLDNADDWKVKEDLRYGICYDCEECGTDFTPQWYCNGKKELEIKEAREKLQAKIDASEDEKMKKIDVNEQIKDSVFCQSCVQKSRLNVNTKIYKKALKKQFKEAHLIEEELDDELQKEYKRQVAIFKEKEQKRKEDTDRQILLMQKKREQLEAKKRAEAIKASEKAKAQAEQIRLLIEQKKNANELAQQQKLAAQQEAAKQAALAAQTQAAQNQANGNAAPIEIIQKLMEEIQKSGVMNNASQEQQQKIYQVLSQQIRNQNINQPDQIVQILRLYMNNLQNDQKRKQQQQAALERQKREEEARKKREQQRLEEERKRQLAAEQERKKKSETDVAITQLLNLIANTPDPNQQQQLLQVLLQQTTNNQEAQQRIIDQVVKMIRDKNQQSGSVRMA